METYSASSVSSIFAKGAVNNENRASVANTSTATTCTPPPVRRVCRSPFVTPNHPLYMFGDSDCTGSKPKPAAAPKKAKNCLESLQDMNISSPTREEEEQHQSVSSPFRRLELSRAFDDDDDDEHTTRVTQHQDTPHCRLRAPPQAPHRVLRNSNTFGMERIQELSIDSPLERKLHVIERDLEGEDGLSIRLRRMKRRLFLENVAGSPQYQYEGHSSSNCTTGAIFFPTTPQPLDETRKSTPRHSNRSSPWPASHELLKAAGTEPEVETEGTMEGMEVVLEDPSSPINHNEQYKNYLSFSSSSDSIQMELEEDGVPAPPAEATFKKCLGDSSVVTEVTAACSTFGAGDEDHPHWVSLSSISEHE